MNEILIHSSQSWNCRFHTSSSERDHETSKWDGPRWGGNENPPTTFDLADALFNEWAVATLVLGALLSMAMIGSSYLVRDERLVNLGWDMGGEDK